MSFELVAVDDGSRDDSAGVLRRCWRQLGEPAPLRTLQLAGVGVSAARNVGWQQARAPLVAFLDADDLCLGQRLAAQAQRLEMQPWLGQVLCGWRRLPETPAGAAGAAVEVEVRPWLEGAGFDLEAAFRCKAVLPSAWMLRRTALEMVGGFDAGLSHAEDVDLLLRLATAGVRGAWVEQILCGYRVHGGGASRQLRPQTRSLLWVLARQLGGLPEGHPLRQRQEELLLGARSWSAWKAWSEGDGELALELWRSAWGASPLGPARTWLHLAQAVESGSGREGHPFRPADLLGDGSWQELEGQVLRMLAARGSLPLPQGAEPPAEPEAAHRRGWSLLVHGYSQAGLELWRLLLGRQLEQFSRLVGDSPCPPEALLERLFDLQELLQGPDTGLGTGSGAVSPAAIGGQEGSRLSALRRRALEWCGQLLAWNGGAQAQERLLAELSQLLVAWAELFWLHSPDSAIGRLEQAFALRPEAPLLRALVRLQRAPAATGAAALAQLAERLELAQAGRALPGDGGPPAGTGLAGLPEPPPSGGRCRGPACQDCALASVAAWERRPLSLGCELWSPPFSDPLAEGQAAPPAACESLPGGRAWLRSPLQSPWGTTVAVAVLDGQDRLRASLSRRYPQPWPACVEASDAPPLLPPVEEEPPQPPLQLEGAVLAVADLSAEIHYHWLLEQLPRLGQALEALPPPQRQGLRLWHNGGEDPRRLELLQELLGLGAERLIDARRHPHIRAERLLVPPFSGRFGWPPAAAQAWLRRRLLSSPPPHRARRGSGRRLWLSRGRTGRRPVWGEDALLALLEERGMALERVVLADLSLREQARLLSQAEWVVAPHGGAMAALVFAAAGTQVLELHPPRYAPPYFHAIVQAQDLRLARCEQPDALPSLVRDLAMEGPLVEPIVLDPPRCLDALRALIGTP